MGRLSQSMMTTSSLISEGVTFGELARMPSMSRECLGASLPTLMLAATSIRLNLRSCGFEGSIDDFLLFCCGAAEGLKARFDTTHQNFEVFQRGSPLPDSLPPHWGMKKRHPRSYYHFDMIKVIIRPGNFILSVRGAAPPRQCHTLAATKHIKKPRPKSGLFYVVLRVSGTVQ